MAMSDRHRWCAAKILEAFKPELDSETVHQFIRTEANFTKFTAFFRGESSGRLFVFYQPVSNGEGEVSNSLNQNFIPKLMCLIYCSISRDSSHGLIVLGSPKS
jgi:hypothetical protein